MKINECTISSRAHNEGLILKKNHFTPDGFEQKNQFFSVQCWLIRRSLIKMNFASLEKNHRDMSDLILNVEDLLLNR